MQAQAKLGVEVGQPVLSELTKWNSSMFGWARRIDLWEFVAMLQVRGPATNKIATPVSIEALCLRHLCTILRVALKVALNGSARFKSLFQSLLMQVVMAFVCTTKVASGALF